MPFLSNEDIKRRKAAGIKMCKLNSGWNISPKVLAKAANIIAAMNPKTEVEKRNKRILQLAFLENMNAAQIARLNDPLIVGAGNRSKGKPLSPSSILTICYKYVPEAKEKTPKRAADERRMEISRALQQKTIKRPKVCSTCGSKRYAELHHIIPLAAGGTNDYFNLIYLCHDCHMKLHHKLYDRLQWENEEKENSSPNIIE